MTMIWDNDYVRGLSPVIAIEQKTGNNNRRSTVGTEYMAGAAPATTRKQTVVFVMRIVLEGICKRLNY